MLPMARSYHLGYDSLFWYLFSHFFYRWLFQLEFQAFVPLFSFLISSFGHTTSQSLICQLTTTFQIDELKHLYCFLSKWFVDNNICLWLGFGPVLCIHYVITMYLLVTLENMMTFLHQFLSIHIGALLKCHFLSQKNLKLPIMICANKAICNFEKLFANLDLFKKVIMKKEVEKHSATNW